MMNSLIKWLPAVVTIFTLSLQAATAQPVQDCPPSGPPAIDEARAKALKAAAQDRGLLWRVEKDGRTSWLYGTIHLGRPEWMMPGPMVQRAIENSDAVALEIDRDELATATAIARRQDQATAPRVLDERRSQRLRLQITRSCLPAEALKNLRPVMLAVVLQLIDARREGLYAELNPEFILSGLAKGAGKRLVGLETAEQQLALTMPANEEEERDLVDLMMDQLESHKGAQLTRRMVKAWTEGDEEMLESFPAWCECLDIPTAQRFFIRVNSQRNPLFADKLAQMHDTGARVFAALNVLQMVGTQSLPRLMRARGFAVERVRFSGTAPAGPSGTVFRRPSSND